jgi:type I site-specific restriction endonuclease
MLSEGADFPWLRTLALRRQVASKTRFVQEVGRVLRVDPTNPDKVCGFVLDPAALLHKLGMDHPEAIGEALDEAATEEAEDLSEKPTEDPEASPRDKIIPRAVRLKEIDAWMLSIIDQLRSKQVISQRSLKFLPRTIKDLCDNIDEPPTDGQWRALDNWTQAKSNILRYLPCEDSREAIKTMVARRDLTKAQSGALITILGWLAEATQAHRSECHETKDYRRLYAWQWPTDLVRLPDPLTPPRQGGLAAR